MLQSPFFSTTRIWALRLRRRRHRFCSRVRARLAAVVLSLGLDADQELFQAAVGEKLQDTAVLSAQVDRMLKDSRASKAIPFFHLQWLGIDDMSEVIKDTKLFPQFNGALVDAMQAETASFADHVVRTGDGLLSTLLSRLLTRTPMVRSSVYGVTQPAAFKTGDQVALDPKERGGLLTQAAFLAPSRTAIRPRRFTAAFYSREPAVSADCRAAARCQRHTSSRIRGDDHPPAFRSARGQCRCVAPVTR